MSSEPCIDEIKKKAKDKGYKVTEKITHGVYSGFTVFDGDVAFSFIIPWHSPEEETICFDVHHNVSDCDITHYSDKFHGLLNNDYSEIRKNDDLMYFINKILS